MVAAHIKKSRIKDNERQNKWLIYEEQIELPHTKKESKKLKKCKHKPKKKKRKNE